MLTSISTRSGSSACIASSAALPSHASVTHNPALTSVARVRRRPPESAPTVKRRAPARLMNVSFAAHGRTVCSRRLSVELLLARRSGLRLRTRCRAVRKDCKFVAQRVAHAIHQRHDASDQLRSARALSHLGLAFEAMTEVAKRPRADVQDRGLERVRGAAKVPQPPALE